MEVVKPPGLVVPSRRFALGCLHGCGAVIAFVRDMIHHLPRLARPLAILGALGLLSGCPDTQGRFDRYNAAYEGAYPVDNTPSACEGDGAVPEAGAADGDYFLALSASAAPTKPVVFSATLTTTEGAEGELGLTLVLQPLAAADRMTPAGDTLTAVGTVAADGSFALEFTNIVVPVEANPVTSNPLEGSFRLSGALCADDYLCGTATGEVAMAGIPVGLDGSTFTATKVASPAEYPEPPAIDCDGNPANPVPSE